MMITVPLVRVKVKWHEWNMKRGSTTHYSQAQVHVLNVNKPGLLATWHFSCCSIIIDYCLVISAGVSWFWLWSCSTSPNFGACLANVWEDCRVGGPNAWNGKFNVAVQDPRTDLLHSMHTACATSMQLQSCSLIEAHTQQHGAWYIHGLCWRVLEHIVHLFQF